MRPAVRRRGLREDHPGGREVPLDAKAWAEGGPSANSVEGRVRRLPLRRRRRVTGYANTLYRARPALYKDPQIEGPADWDLSFAERLGVEIEPERTVTDVQPIGASDGSEGYYITHEWLGWWLQRSPQRITARGVVVSAGALGTKLRGSVPPISDRHGRLVRTNSESILAVTAPDDSRDFTKAVAITSSIYPDPDTHIEPVTYGKGADSQSLLYTLMTEAGRRGTQSL
jgi:hypothetical protein